MDAKGKIQRCGLTQCTRDAAIAKAVDPCNDCIT